MKYLTILFTLTFLLSAVDETYAQPLSVNVEQPANGNRLFATSQGKFSISGTTVRFGEREISDHTVWSLSATSNRFSYLDHTGGEVRVNQYSNSGHRLYSETLPFFKPDDSTLKLYTFTDGRTVVRDNVANFSFLDPAGQQLFSISNSSGSQSGERPSELAADPSGITIALYNPAISYGETTGSRAVLVYGENDTDQFFSSENQEITDLQVTQDSKYILLVVQDGSSSEIYFSDRFGNILFTLPSDHLVQGAEISESGEFLTIYTTGMVQVYHVLTGERLGSASLNQNIIYAAYDPEKNIMISFGGVVDGYQISGPSVMVVDINQRSIVTEEISSTLHTLDTQNIRLNRSGSGNFTIEGLHEEVTVRY
ncbi:MAG TPA: hypothetical protein VK040_06235 [Balneolaceae bacterium]|nr:hypothetical protein [Balneolaceae bacterium]